MGRLLLILGSLAVCSLGVACKTLPEDKSAFASSAGESTIVLGACQSEFKKGWDTCLVEKGPNFKMPTLRFITTTAAQWAVSDCELGLYQTGSIDKKGVVEVDLSGLSAQVIKNHMCILKIEQVEQYPDQRDKNQMRYVYIRGGLFVEAVDPGYFPTPTNDVLAFCVKVARTTKGRTKIENCKP